MPRLRFTVRGMMIAVAVAGVGVAILVELFRASPLAFTYQNAARFNSMIRDEAEAEAEAAEKNADEHAILRASDAERKDRDKAARRRAKAASCEALLQKIEGWPWAWSHRWPVV